MFGTISGTAASGATATTGAATEKKDSVEDTKKEEKSEAKKVAPAAAADQKWFYLDSSGQLYCMENFENNLMMVQIMSRARLIPHQ